MKDYKWKKFAIMMVIAIAIGAISGRLIRFTLANGSLGEVAQQLVNMAPLMYVLAVGLGIVSILGYFYFNAAFKRENYTDEEGSFYERHEKAWSVFMICGTLCIITNFTAIGVNLNTETSMHMLIFVNVVLGFISEVAHVSLIKKVRPELNADPTDTKFHKNYFDQLDEYEKQKIGKACYQTTTAMNMVYVGMFLACYIITILLEVSPIVCLPVGIIWFIQAILHTYHGNKK